MRDHDKEEFEAFCERYGDAVATGMLEDISCRSTDSTWPWRIEIADIEKHDREGLNVTLSGYVTFRAKAWEFIVEDGNWNGTVVKAWDRCWKVPCVPPPPQSVWLYAPVQAVIVRIMIDGMMPALATMTKR